MVYWAELQKRVETPVLKLDNGQCPEGTFVGPFLLEPPDTVVVVPPGHQAAFDDFGNLVVEPAP
jgi:N-methylhydantoinase A/oxoprolinase/acetone carboxylase beta subunit